MKRISNFICLCFLLIMVSTSCDNDSDTKKGILPDVPVISNEDDEEDLGGQIDLSFLHISDTHKSEISISPMVDSLNVGDYDFGIVTGDLCVNESMMNILLNSEKPIFLVPGNHDAYDIANGQSVFRHQVLDKLQNHEIINYGSEEGNYYYTDLIKNGRTTRIIGIDQYEVDKVGKARTNDVVMSQHQIDWFVHLLENSYQVDGIVILIHCGFGNYDIGCRNVDNRNSFISTLAYDYTSYLFFGSGYPLMIPDIVNAYMTGVNIEDRVYPSGFDGVNINVKTSFEGQHHNFVGYFGGHTHWDLCEFLPDYPMQLQILMCYCGTGSGKYNLDFNDIIKTESGDDSWNINRNAIDYNNKTLSIYRLGARNLCTGGTRDSIQFVINQ